MPSAATDGEDYSICLEALTNASVTTLQCSHKFHVSCVTELRKFKLKQVCPLCRAPLPPGSEKLFVEAIQRYMVVHQLVERGEATWSTLPAKAQSDLDEAITGLRAAAEQGLADAQHTLGEFYMTGLILAQHDKEAARRFTKAANQGHDVAQYFLGLFFRKAVVLRQHRTTRKRLDCTGRQLIKGSQRPMMV